MLDGKPSDSPPPPSSPTSFAFTDENADLGQAVRSQKYPEGRQASAVISLLWKRAGAARRLAAPEGDRGGRAPELGMPNIRVLEVATFYTMFNA